MASRHTRAARYQRRGGLGNLAQGDWETRRRHVREWVEKHQQVAVYKTSGGSWTLLRVVGYLDAGILGAFRFSEQREIAESVLGL